MLIGHFSRKPMAKVVEGDTVPDPIDIFGEFVNVRDDDGHFTIEVAGRPRVTLNVMEAEELAFSILTMVEVRADLSYTIQRTDRDQEPPKATDAERALIDGLLYPYVPDRETRSQLGEEIILSLR